jgi:AraC-like DNA-binding protein
LLRCTNSKSRKNFVLALNDKPSIENDPLSGRKRERVESIKAYVSQNLTADLHAAAVARKFKLSISSFHHLFKKYENLPYRQYVEKIKMQTAMELLQTESIRVKEVMYATGYSNRKTFNRAFKKMFQHSPAYFAK